MVGSGLRIFNAYPAFARRGETFCCYPLEGQPIPRALTFGGWLAGARNWHFAMMWVLVVERARLPRLHLPPRRVARPRAAARRRSRRRGDDEVLSLRAAAIIRARASTTRCRRLTYFVDADRRRSCACSRASRSGSRCSSRRSPRCSAATCGRATGTSWRWSLLVAARARPRLHGVRRRSVLAALDDHRAGTTRRDRPRRATRGPFYHLCRRRARTATAARGPQRAMTLGSTVAVPHRELGGVARRGSLARRVRLDGSARARRRCCELAERKNEGVERALFRHTSMDRAARERARRPGERFPSYFVSNTVPVWDEAARGVVAARGRRARCAVRCRSRSTTREAAAHRRSASITSASRAGPRVATWTGVRVSELARARRRHAGRAVRRLPVVRQRLPRELGHRERDASADARRVRHGRPLLDAGHGAPARLHRR